LQKLITHNVVMRYHGFAYWEMEDGQYAIIPPSLQVIIWLTYSMVLSARLVPCMLTDVQKADHAETSASLLTLLNENMDNFISGFVTLDETRLHHFDPESKAQRMAWKHVISLPLGKFCVAVISASVAELLPLQPEAQAIYDLSLGERGSGLDTT